MSELNGTSRHTPQIPKQVTPPYVQYRRKVIEPSNMDSTAEAVIGELEQEKINVQCAAVVERMKVSQKASFLKLELALGQKQRIAAIDREENACVKSIDRLINEIRGGLFTTPDLGEQNGHGTLLNLRCQELTES